VLQGGMSAGDRRATVNRLADAKAGEGVLVDTSEVLENIVLREAPDVTEAHTVQRVDTAP
jgi:hypothetical protein